MPSKIGIKQKFVKLAREYSYIGVPFILRGGFPKDEYIPLGEVHKQINLTIDKVKQEAEKVKQGVLKPFEAKRGAFIQIARDHAKSSLLLSRILWELGKNPNLIIKIVCASEELAKKRIAFLRTHIETNKNLHLLFPNLKPHSSLSWSTTQLYVQRDIISIDPSVEACGVLGTHTGSHCVVRGTPIITSKGLRPIEEVKVGDFVFNTTGKFQRVVATSERFYKGKVYYIKSALQDFIRVGLTPEHKVLVRYVEDNIPKVEWFSVEEIARNPKQYLLAFPKAKFVGTHKIFSNKSLQEQFAKLYGDKDFWRFLGYYLAEGCVTNWMADGISKKKIGHGKSYRVRLVFGSHENFYIEDVVSILSKFGIDAHVYNRGSSTEITFYNKLFWKVLTTFGHMAYNKTIPTWVISTTKMNKREFLTGYIRGDGCIVGNRLILTTASPHITSLLSLFVSEFDCLPCITTKEAGYSYIRGEQIKHKDAFCITLSFSSEEKALFDLVLGHPCSKFQPKRWKSDDLYYYVPIDKVEEENYEGWVYDLQTKKGSSFCSLFITLHNCSMILFDDIVDFKSAFVYPENLKKIESAVKENWLNILKSDGWFIAIFTPWTKEDVTLKMKQQIDLYYVFERMIDENYTPIWPEKYSREALIQKEKEIGTTAFLRGFRGILPESTTLFREDAIAKCYDHDFSFGEYPEGTIFFIGVDLGHRAKKDAPQTCIFTLGITPNKKRIPVSIKVGNYTSTQTAHILLQEARKYNPQLILVENNGYQQSFLDWIKTLDDSADLPIEGYFTGSQKMNPNTGIPSLAVEFEKGIWILPMKNFEQEHSEFCKCGYCTFLSQLKTFPHGGFSDAVMACFFALQAYKKMYQSGINVRVLDIPKQSEYKEHNSLEEAINENMSV